MATAVVDVLWECRPFNAGPFNIIVHNITAGILLPAAAGGAAAADPRTYWADHIIRSSQFGVFNGFTLNTTRLIIIRHTGQNICIFTLKLIEGSEIVELFDFFKVISTENPIPKGLSTIALMACLSEVRRLNPRSNRTLWLGTVEPKLVKHYMNTGFCLVVPKELGPSFIPEASTRAREALARFDLARAAAPPLAGPVRAMGFPPHIVAESNSRLREQRVAKLRVIYEHENLDRLLELSRHTISPLATLPPGGSCWSFTLPLSEPFDPAEPGSFTIALEDLPVRSKILDKELRGHIATFEFNISQSYLEHLYTIPVMTAVTEAVVIIANTHKDDRGDTLALWNGKTYRADLDLGYSSMPTDPRLIVLMTSMPELSEHITGHTHPAALYALMSSKKGLIQDLSPPSYGDFHGVLLGNSPGHIVFAVECAYLMKVHPRVAYMRDIVTTALANLKANIDNISQFSSRDYFHISPLQPEYLRFKAGKIGPAAAVSNRGERRLRAEFMVEKLNSYFILTNGEKIVDVSIHLWPNSPDGQLKPMLSVSSEKPGSLFNTTRTKGMSKIIELTSKSQQEALDKAISTVLEVDEFLGKRITGLPSGLLEGHTKSLANLTRETLEAVSKRNVSTRNSRMNPLNQLKASTAAANATRANALTAQVSKLKSHETGVYADTVVFSLTAPAAALQGRVHTMSDLFSLVQAMVDYDILVKFTDNDLDLVVPAAGAAAAGAPAVAAAGAPAVAAGAADIFNQQAFEQWLISTSRSGAAGGSRKKISSHSRRKRNKKGSKKTRKH